MNAEAVVSALVWGLLASGAAMLLVLALRLPLRAWLGPRAAYLLWGCVPASALAVSLPARRVLVDVAPMATLRLGDAWPVAGPVTMPSLGAWLVLFWLLGAVSWGAALTWRQRRFLRSLGMLQGCGDGLFRAEAVAGLPAVVGLLKPRIVLPHDFAERYTPEEQRLVLAHEQVHRQRGDLWANALAALALCLHWFNPLVHYALRRFRHDQELACDAVVIARLPQSRMAYGTAMLKSSSIALPAPMGCQWMPRHPLKDRIVMLKRKPLSRRRLLLARVIATCLIAATGYAAWARQPVTAVGKKAVSREAGIDTKQKALSPPRYPAEALKHAQGGKVVVLVDFDAQGKATNVQVETSEPKGVFDAAVLEAARAWRFHPAIENGKAVAGRVRVPVMFEVQMRPAATPAGYADGDYVWYRGAWEASKARVCDVVLADAGAASDALSLCGIRTVAAR